MHAGSLSRLAAPAGKACAVVLAALLVGCNSLQRGVGESDANAAPSPVVARADAAAAGMSTTRVDDPVPAHGLRLPATFRGDLPCADCAGVRHHLDLWPDQVFHLRREWLGKDMVRGDMGRWRVDPSRRALVLHGGAEMPLQFQVLGPERLRQLDLAGEPIVSELPYELSSDGTLEMADIPSFFLGQMTYMADSARFTDCLTGRSYPIAPGEQALQLQREYLATVSEPGGKLMVHFEGVLKQWPGMEGGRLQPTLVVDRFIAVRPEASCGPSRATASLTNTYWRIERMRGARVEVVGGRREPHIILREVDGERSFAATVGCNQFVGKLEMEGASLRFAGAATTLMACPPPLAEMEQQLRSVLENTRGWHVTGNVLGLRNEAGDDIALLVAVYL
ncbi:META domain-containing protein [Wenzhouxiangella sp. XN24]|uniref:META domain-containing protein n=1 Tax=Wenzhouxiangella sp. XN24 TaxID=2713569 RepID=UPI0013ED96A1|nr:META domain-containing protein [Wenzhouxiangella sp. XN24]NGX14779.1 META domain-containing protein [Wenzhouxiangella sp. XN24]